MKTLLLALTEAGLPVASRVDSSDLPKLVSKHRVVAIVSPGVVADEVGETLERIAGGGG